MKTDTKMELVVQQPLLELMEACESYCVAGCCGPDAFEITAEQIGAWISVRTQEQALMAAAQLRVLIEEVKACGQTIHADRFNASWSSAECVAWLSQWEAALSEALKQTR